MGFKSIVKKTEVGFLRVVLVIGRKLALWGRFILTKLKAHGGKYLKTVVASIIVLYVIGAVVFGTRLYKQQRQEKIDRYASYIFPFPVASTGRALIFDKELQQKVYWAQTFASKMQMQIPSDLAKRIMDDLIYDSVVMQEANRMGIAVTKADIDKTFDLAAGGIGGEDQATSFVKANYNMSLRQFKRLLVPKIALEKIRDNNFAKVKARHFLVKDEKKAQELQKKIWDGAKFEDIAKDNSEDQSSKDKGGLLADGEFLFKETSGLPESIETALFKLKTGEVSDVIKSDLGYHVLKVDERQGTIELTMTDWLNDLKKKYPVRIVLK